MSLIESSKVAIILCTYEPEAFLEDQVDSINSQIGVDTSIYIFDDGTLSKKGKCSLNSVRNRVKSIEVGDPTKSAGKNFLRSLMNFDVENFDYVAFSDQDDIWLNDKLLHAINQLELKEGDGYSSDLIIFDGKKEVGILKKSSKQTSYDYYFQGASAGCTYVMSKKLVRVLQREIFKHSKVIDLSERISHDWLVYFIARTNGYVWITDSAAKILYRQHENNVYGARRNIFMKFKMVFGSWYMSNIKLVSKFRNKDIDNFDVDISTFRKILFFPNCLKMRREKINSIVCYLFWIFKYDKIK